MHPHVSYAFNPNETLSVVCVGSKTKDHPIFEPKAGDDASVCSALMISCSFGWIWINEVIRCKANATDTNGKYLLASE